MFGEETTPAAAIQCTPQDYIHQAKPGLREVLQTSPSVETQHKLHPDADESEPTLYGKTEIRFPFGSRGNPQDDVNKSEPITHQETLKLAPVLGSQLHSQNVQKPDRVPELHLRPESVRTLWQSGHSVQSISPEQLSPDDVIIAYVSFTSSPGIHDICTFPSVVGPSGTGKSSVRSK